MNIDLHIEELILHGFPPGDRHAIAGAVQSELTRLLAEGGVPGGLAGEHARVDGGAFNVRHGAGAEAIGEQVAQAVHGGLKR